MLCFRLYRQRRLRKVIFVLFKRMLKQNSTRELWKRYPAWLRHHFWKEHTFWSDGYFVCSIGEASPETVRKYIENQG